MLVPKDQIAQDRHKLYQVSFLEIRTGNGRWRGRCRPQIRCLLCLRLLLELRIAVQVTQLVQNEDDLGNTALRHALRANLLLILDKLLERLLASIYQNRCRNTRYL